MALEIFDGIPGSGKSYSAMALRILPHLAAGGVVVTNVEVIPEGVGAWILQRTGRKWNPSRLRILKEDQCPTFFHHVPKGTVECPVLVVLDEIHLWFNARDWSKNDAKCRETFELATQHRKFNLNIVLISQHLSNVDGQFLKLIAGLSRFRNLKNTPLVPWLPFLRIPFFRFLALHYDKSGRTLVKRDWMVFDKLVGGSYKTEAVLKGGEVMEGAEVMQREELAKDPVVAARFKMITRTVFALLAVAVVALTWWLARGTDKPETVVAKPAVPAPTKPAAVEKAAPAPAPLPPEKPVPWIERKPVVPTLAVMAVSGTRKSPRLLVDLDGFSQWLQSGGFCSRGRIGYVRNIGHGFQLHEITIWDDSGETVVIRGVLQKPGPAGAQSPHLGIPNLPPLPMANLPAPAAPNL